MFRELSMTGGFDVGRRGAGFVTGAALSVCLLVRVVMGWGSVSVVVVEWLRRPRPDRDRNRNIDRGISVRRDHP